MTGWRDRWLAIVASDVSGRDGLGWEFDSLDRSTAVWAVFREDGGAFPVFSSSRGNDDLPPQHHLRAMTGEAVTDLLLAAGIRDEVGWITRNITTALMTASLDIASWEGVECALESDDGDRPIAWADPGEARVPYDWLRARTDAGDVVVQTYQDDTVFGLSFIPAVAPQHPRSDVGSMRSRRNIPLVTGRINQVEVVFDTVVEGGACAGLVTEVLLHGNDCSTLLIAAEADSRSYWQLHDESVVALTDVTAADALKWHPERRHWRPTEGRRP